MSGLLAGAIMGLAAVIAHTFVQNHRQRLIPLAGSLRLPPRLLEIVATVLLAAPAAFAILSLLSALGILTL